MHLTELTLGFAYQYCDSITDRITSSLWKCYLAIMRRKKNKKQKTQKKKNKNKKEKEIKINRKKENRPVWGRKAVSFSIKHFKNKMKCELMVLGCFFQKQSLWEQMTNTPTQLSTFLLEGDGTLDELHLFKDKTQKVTCKRTKSRVRGIHQHHSEANLTSTLKLPKQLLLELHETPGDPVPDVTMWTKHCLWMPTQSSGYHPQISHKDVFF